MRMLSLFLAFTFLAAICQPIFAQTPNRSADDLLYDKVRQRLAADRDVKGGAIDVDVKDGVVTLRGKVREAKQKTKAEHVAKKVKGVKQVVNQLEIELPASAPNKT